MPSVAEVLNARCGHVVAPAGCGKTELIINSIASPTEKPALVLTHTTAGVAALRHRLKKAGVASANYRLNTIAGWALTILSMFPERSGYQHNPIDSPDYRQIQIAVSNLCQSGDITSELRSTYSRLLVDEYQDCSVSQHGIVTGIANAIPTIVFGDPMQAIFGFGGDPLPDWVTAVGSAFPLLGELNTPWRWNNASANELGTWLLAARHTLVSGGSIDLRTCPSRVSWHPLSHDRNANLTAQIAAQYAIANAHPKEALLIIGDSRQVSSRHNYASRSKGVGVVERVDFPDTVGFAAQMTDRTGEPLLQSCIGFLIKVMTNVYGDVLQTRIQSILAGRNRNPPTQQELTAIALYQGGGLAEAADFLSSMAADRNRRIYRMSAFNIMLDALRSTVTTPSVNLNGTIAQLREQRRHAGSSIPSKAVGSTLLLKGLEADHVLILDADNPTDIMTKEHLYVALTRGAKSITIFSRNPVLP
jgi:hypothetical protein